MTDIDGDPNIVHVYPTNDLVDHITSTSKGDCPCGPTTEPVMRDDGTNGWLLIHHSLDGREKNEAKQ